MCVWGGMAEGFDPNIAEPQTSYNIFDVGNQEYVCWKFQPKLWNKSQVNFAKTVNKPSQVIIHIHKNMNHTVSMGF